jgi:phosphotriesterase-related protein
MTFVRTVTGDVDPGELGVTYAHEHLVIDGGRPVELSPDFLLADVDRMATELTDAAAAGLQAAIDAMPADCGRNPAKLAELSRRTGVRIVAGDRASSRAVLRARPLEHARERGRAGRPLHC